MGESHGAQVIVMSKTRPALSSSHRDPAPPVSHANEPPTALPVARRVSALAPARPALAPTQATLPRYGFEP